ncbi:MAG: MFS transporter [Natronomonas sp.]|uniref:MFS transporter n=1 Tax=Natronomonas sp. TaxID=2184060 RepID=UPI00286FEE69|nr:MFS transporter [Natronomonas sp.]MDR9429775.1 MFS transporter [Natronomonas sp.]
MVARRWRNLIGASGALALSAMLWFNYSAVLPLIIDDWGLSGVDAGLVYSAFQVGYLLLVVPMGMVSDRYDPRYIIASGATAAALSSIGFALFAAGTFTGSILRFAAGVGVAGVYVPGMKYVSTSFNADRGRAMGIYVGTFSAASGASFVLASWVGSTSSWPVAIGVTSLLALLAPAVILLVGRPPVSAENGDDADLEARREGIDLRILSNPRYLLTVSTYSAHNWELYGVRNWLPAFLASTVAIAGTSNPAATAGLLAGAMTAVGAVGNVFGGALSDWIDRPTVIAAGLTISGTVSLSIGGLQWLPLWALTGVVLVYGIVVTVDSAPTSTMITEVVDDGRVGSALAIQAFVGTLPGIVAPVIFGATVDHSGYALAFQTLGVAAFVGVGTVVLVRSRFDVE